MFLSPRNLSSGLRGVGKVQERFLGPQTGFEMTTKEQKNETGAPVKLGRRLVGSSN
jgi:hypothetical protein